MTQQQVADWLVDKGFDITRESVGRIEAGKQNPHVQVLDAMAKLYRTEVWLMVDYTPEQAAKIQSILALSDAELARLARIAAAAKDEAS